jgi:hypothetical protein
MPRPVDTMGSRLSITQKRKVTILHPCQQRACLAQIAGIEARAHSGQILRRGAGGVAHSTPVGAGHAHVAHAAFNLRGQRFERAGIDDTVHFKVLKGFEPLLLILRIIAAISDRAQLPGCIAGHRQNRMGHEMQGQRALRERQADRVDQEGHVVIHDFYDGVRRGIAIFAHGGIEYPYQRGAPAPQSEQQMRKRNRSQFCRIAPGEIRVLDVRIIGLKKQSPVEIPHGFRRTSRRACHRRDDFSMLNR